MTGMRGATLGRDVGAELLYRMMRIRYVEETIAARYSEWEMRCPTHLSIGQEAVAAALGLLMSSDDLAVSSHRSHAHYLGKGGNLDAMIAEIYGKVAGCSRGKGGSMHLIDKSVGFMGATAIVGGTIPIAVGLGLAMKHKGQTSLACAFFGDGAVEEGVFYESANFAVLHALPVVFVCENNRYSVYSPLEVRQPAGRRITDLAGAIGVRALKGDGNDALEVHRLAAERLADVRDGAGPLLLELDTYRWREHCGPNYDDDLGYRPVDEVAAWRARDPVHRLQQVLLAAGTLDGAALERMESDIEREVRAAFENAGRAAFPEPVEAHEQVIR